MVNETIDYEKLIKAKYPDAVLIRDSYSGYIWRTAAYWIKIESIHFTSQHLYSYNQCYAWPVAYNELKRQNLL